MRKVLLVDDEPIAVEGLRLMTDWEKRGFRVDGVCYDGEEAIQRILSDPPDLVVTDIRMPVVDGLELIEETRRSGNEETIFVITSGYTDFEYARRAMSLGVSYYLTKPMIDNEVDEVLNQLEQALNQRERSRWIRELADDYKQSYALSVILFGGDDTERREALLALSALPEQASHWTYLHIRTDEACGGEPREAARQLIDEYAFCHWINYERNTFGLVVGWGSSDAGDIRLFAERLLHAIRSATFGKAHVGIAVGSAVQRLEDLAQSREDAAEAERFLFYGHELVHYEDIRDCTLAFDPAVLKAVDVIVGAMEEFDQGRLHESIREAFRRFEEQRVDPELIGIFATQVQLRCASVYQELGGDPDELLRERGIGAFTWRERSLRETAEQITAFCLQCKNASSALRERATGGTTAKVAAYLRQHYTETFTIKELAEQFYVNPVYLGQSFSRRYGRSIVDYVHDLRIEEAKGRLHETSDASCAIAESVGYNGYQQFLKHFEKRLGMKPAEYRQMHSSGNSTIN